MQVLHITKSQTEKKNVILFITVVQIAENAIQSVLFAETYDPPFIAHAQITASNCTSHEVTEKHRVPQLLLLLNTV